MKRILLALFFLFTYSTSYSQFTSNIELGTYVRSLSYVSPGQGVKVAAEGQDVTLRILADYYSDTKERIEDVFLNAALNSWIRLVQVYNMGGGTFTVVINFLPSYGVERTLYISAPNSSNILTYVQPKQTYISPTGDQSYIPTEVVEMTLYNSMAGANYILFNGDMPHMPYFYVYGNGGTVKFQYQPTTTGRYHHLLYSGVITQGPRFYPFSVCIAGSPLVSNLRNVELDPDGGEYTFRLNALNSPVPANEMTTIARKISSGVVESWGSRFGMEVEELIPRYQYDVKIIYPPNTLSEDIVSTSPFLTTPNGSGPGFNTIFRQPPGGRLEIFDVGYKVIDEFRSKFAITLSGSQYGVEYVLKRDGNDYAVMKGTGKPIHFDLQSSGTYTVTARLDEQVLEMNGSEFAWIGMNPYSPSSNMNYILKKVYSNKERTQGYGEMSYLDDLGFPVQLVQINNSSNSHSLYQPIVYDAAGRDDAKTYLPYASLRSGDYHTNDLTRQSTYYGELFPRDHMYAYTEKIYEASPLNRPVAIINAGSVYRNNDVQVTFEYGLNEQGEVRKFSVTSSGGLQTSGYYDPGKLAKVTTTNEDGQVSSTFTDHFDNLVLERIHDGDTFVDNYFVYDYRNRLAYVLPPELSAILTDADGTVLHDDDVRLKNYAYVYKYDHRNHCNKKRLPGCEWEHYIHDRSGNVLMWQDGNMREHRRWLINEYDALDRISAVWISIPIELTLEQLRNSVKSNGSAAYRWSCYKQVFYDDYDYPQEYFKTALVPVPGVVDSQVMDGRTHNLVTFTAEKILEGGIEEANFNSVSRVYFYDYRNRVIQEASQNHLGGISRSSYKYDFTGNLLVKHESHQLFAGADPDILITEYRYDPRGRLLGETSSLNGGPEATVRYRYDELGRMESRSYGDGPAIDERYTYNIRGWETSRTNPYFAMNLRYHDPLSGSTPQYGGNISEWTWRYLEPGVPVATETNTYGFTYDALNRLTDSRLSTLGKPDDRFVEKGITYDLNGNIKSLERVSMGQTVNNLSYSSYNGNQLITLTDGAPGGGTYHYSYDANGNTVSDGRQGVTFTYNYLNLISTAEKPGTGRADYRWLADGTKLGVKKDNNGYEYLGSLVYGRINNALSLESASFGGGRFAVTGNTVEPNYFITDHLGSTRVVVDNSGNVKGRHDYHPFGLTWANPETQTGTNRYLYNGKESQEMAGLDLVDYGWRMYDANAVKWPSGDPFAEKYSGISPYSFVDNNPIRNIEIDGRDWFYNELTGEIYYNASYDASFTSSLGEGWVHWGPNGMFDLSDINLIGMFNGTPGKHSQDGSLDTYIGAQMSLAGGLTNDFLSSVNYIVVPAQAFINEQGNVQYVNTGPYSVRTESGIITSITERIAYVPTNCELSNEDIIQIINTNTGFGSALKAFAFGQFSSAKRVRYQYRNSNTPYKAATSRTTGSGYITSRYSSWDAYSKDTRGKGRLLKYK